MRFNKLFFLVSNRPEFCDLEKWLESLLLHLEVGLPLLSDMTFTLLPGTLMRKISETSDGDDQTYRKRDTSFRSAHRSLSWHQQSLRDTEIQKNLTFARFCVQITATTWFQSMLAAFVGNFCSRSCFGSLGTKQLPCVQHTLLQTPTRSFVNGLALEKQKHFLCGGNTVEMESTLQTVRPILSTNIICLLHVNIPVSRKIYTRLQMWRGYNCSKFVHTVS